MKSIFQYKIEIVDFQTIELPAKAKILKAGFQKKALCIWVLIDTSERLETRTIRIIATGKGVDDMYNWTYADSVLDYPHVWHVFING